MVALQGSAVEIELVQWHLDRREAFVLVIFAR